MADEMRNEVEVDFAGRKVTLRASIEAMRAIENETKKGIIRTIREFGEADYSSGTVEAILYYGAKAGENELSRKEIAEAIGHYGLEQASSAAMSFLHICMTGVSLGKPEPQKAA